MQTLQTNPPQSIFQPAMPLPNGGTLDDYRMMHSNYDTGGSFSAKARPALIIAVAIGAALFGMNYFSGHNAATTDATAVTPPLRTPTAASVPVSSEVPAAKTPEAIEPTSSPIKQTELNSLPPARQSKNSSSELTKPVKAKSSVAAKASSTTAKNNSPIPVTPPMEFPPPQQEVPPPPVPAPAPIPEITPPVPAPAPEVSPIAPPKL